MICTLFLPDFAPAAAWACSSTGCLRKCRHHECAWRAGDGATRTAIIRTACPLWTHRSTRTTIIKQVDAAARDDDVLAEVRWPATRQPHARPSEMMRASYFRFAHRPRRWRSAGTTLGSTSDAGHNPGGVCSGARGSSNARTKCGRSEFVWRRRRNVSSWHPRSTGRSSAPARASACSRSRTRKEGRSGEKEAVVVGGCDGPSRGRASGD